MTNLLQKLTSNQLLCRLIVLVGLVIPMQNTEAQDVSFSQFYSNPQYLNPAMTGSTACPHMVINYRNQFPSLPAAYVSTAAGFDFWLPKIYSGFGAQLLREKEGNGAVSKMQFALDYAVTIPVSKTNYLRFGIEPKIMQQSFDFSTMVFPSQINPLTGEMSSSTEMLPQMSRFYYDFASGVAFLSPKFYFGVAVHNMLQTKEIKQINPLDFLHRKYTLHMGSKVTFGKKMRTKSQKILSPNFILQIQENSKQLNYGVYFANNLYVGGLWFRQNLNFQYDSFIFLFGIVFSRYKFAYSFDLPISKMGLQTAGSHELSLTIQFPCIQKNKQWKAISCPEF